MLRSFWKRFAASATDFVRKYRFDPFFRTQVSVILLQAAFAALIFAIVLVTAIDLHNEASTVFTQELRKITSLPMQVASVSNSIIAQIDYMSYRTVLTAAAFISIVTIIFSYIVLRVALRPTRMALQSQKRFIGNVAHELRTPLSVIKTNTEVALMNPDIAKELRGVFEGTITELDRMSEILDNLLSLSVSIRPERMKFREVDVGSVVRDALRKLHPLSDSKNLRVQLHLSDFRIVWGNEAAIQQIAMNILKNAIAYTPNRGRILVEVEPVHPDMVSLLVQDSGSGIAREHLLHIFEPYYRGDRSRRRGDGGGGLGLTIVSELVKSHGGRITVRSAEGVGTTVQVFLPASKQGKDGGEQSLSGNLNELAVDFTNASRA